MCFHYIPYSNCLKCHSLCNSSTRWDCSEDDFARFELSFVFSNNSFMFTSFSTICALLHICRKVVMYYYDVLGLFRLYIWWLFLKGRNGKQIYFVLSDWCTAPTVCESLIYHKIWKRLQWQHDWCWINASSAALVLYYNRQTLFAAKNQSLIHYQWSGFGLYITTF